MDLSVEKLLKEATELRNVLEEVCLMQIKKFSMQILQSSSFYKSYLNGERVEKGS
jgi:hypothetical protein